MHYSIFSVKIRVHLIIREWLAFTELIDNAFSQSAEKFTTSSTVPISIDVAAIVVNTVKLPLWSIWTQYAIIGHKHSMTQTTGAP